MRQPARRAPGKPDRAGPATRRLVRVLAVALQQSRAGASPGQAVAKLRIAADGRPEPIRDARDHCRSLLHLLPGDACLRRADLLLAAALHPSAARLPPRPGWRTQAHGQAGHAAHEEAATMRQQGSDNHPVADGTVGGTRHRMDLTTRQNLLTAMRTEAFEYLKYLLCARQARANGRAELAELFEQVATQERLEHFAAEAELVGLLGSDAENLRDACRAEGDEADRVYRGFAEQAAAAGERAAAEHFARLGADERVHRDAFRSAVRHLDVADPAE